MIRWSSSKARWVAALACALATLYGTSLRAGTTGKIAGQVTDRATGQPIPGAAVLIEGLRLGSTTDADGRYFIIGVPPGSYSVKASLLGYAPITREGVIVNIDRTTPADFQLASSAIEVEALTVVAPREVIQLDVAGSRSTLAPEDVVALPNVTSLAGAISAEPGGNFRSGLAEETQLMLNGHMMTDDRVARYNASSIPITSVQEVQILTS
ncbi:MAG TPA: carboxypeptidase-like regulatory domain-containing protein, partial [Candidatus Latescibacteria bacterium]|nr:carboxypeptidase-like regulatory domain-containing protein [Candidatus Latescibacterota bacterium]